MQESPAGPGRRPLRPGLVIVVLVAIAGVAVGGRSLLMADVNPGATAAPSGSAAAGGPSPASPSATSIAAGPTPSASVSPTPVPSATPAPTPSLVPAALTGLLVTPSAAVQHPIAVMVDDHRDARPQAGFNAADQVWQAPAEGGIPRYMLIFQSRLPSLIGPIRSAREYFIDWASELDAAYAHIGGSGQAMATLRASGRGQLVYNVDGLRFDGSDMWRVTFRAAPHNLYSDGRHLRRMAALVGAVDGPVTPAWQFATPIATDARPSGTRIVVRYPYETITYRYDPGTDRYLRYIDGSRTPQVDAADGAPVAPTNVVILRMRFGPLNDGHPQKGRLEAFDTGTGEAIISSGGAVIDGTWRKATQSAPTLLYGPDGSPVTLAPGQTFVQVIALSYGYQVTPGTLPRTGLRYH